MSEPTSNGVDATLATLVAAAPQSVDLVEDLHRLNAIQQTLSRRLDTVDT